MRNFAVLERRGLAEDFEAREWDFHGATTDHLTHGIHRYSGKFIPQVAARAIQLVTERGDLILDPYVGSGTTLVEAAIGGRRAVGIDVNPLAIMIAKVKTTPIPADSLEELYHRFTRFAAAEGDLFSGGHSEWLPTSASRLNDPWFNKWFEQEVLHDLCAISDEIERVHDEKQRRLLQVALSEILRRSSRAHQGYPNVMYDKSAKPRPRPGPNFLRTLRQITRAVATLNHAGTNWNEVEPIIGDARALPLAAGEVDAVVTHPPYVASIPYAEYLALSLKWFGWEPKVIDRMLTGGRRQSPNVVQRFDRDYALMIAEAARVLRHGGHLFLLVGDPVVRGNKVDLAEMSVTHAERADLALVARSSRTGQNRRANKMGDETLLLFRKG